MTDLEIQSLLELPKMIRKKDAKKLAFIDEEISGGDRRFDVKLLSESKIPMHLRGRLSVDDPTTFSVILSLEGADSGSDFILMRCNGSHRHHNYIERTLIRGMHIHVATERYIELGRKNEGYAEPTNEYSDFDGALDCMMRRAHIYIEGSGEEPSIFD